MCEPCLLKDFFAPTISKIDLSSERTLVRDGAASCDGRVQLGDRILAVNGHSIVGADYQRFVHDILGTPMLI